MNKIGLAVRGLYGEGTEAMGNLFQISNQTTLGETEDEIIDTAQPRSSSRSSSTSKTPRQKLLEDKSRHARSTRSAAPTAS